MIFGSYELQIPKIAPGFDDTGRSGQASMRYGHPLPRLSWLRQQIALGYDLKTTKTDLDFGGYTVFASAAEIDQFPLSYEATETDPFGRTLLHNDLVLSPGGITGQNTNNNFATLVPGAKARYVYDWVALTRLTRLPVKSEAQLGAFWDYANLTQVQPIPDQQSTVDLASVGGDLSYALGCFVSVDTSIGWQLRPRPGTTKTGAFGQVSLVAGF